MDRMLSILCKQLKAASTLSGLPYPVMYAISTEPCGMKILRGLAYLVVLNSILDVDEPDDLELSGNLGRPVSDDVQALLRDRLRRDAACRVTCNRV